MARKQYTVHHWLQDRDAIQLKLTLKSMGLDKSRFSLAIKKLEE